MKITNGVSLRQISKRFSLVLGLVAVCISGIGAMTIVEVGSIRDDWNHYRQNAQVKNAMIHDVISAVGYGGAIHHFKNFVMRKDSPHIEKINQGFDKAQDVLREYRKLDLTGAEIKALDDVSAVFSQYSRAVKQVVAMAGDGASSMEIDKAVKIDDSPAIKGLSVLKDTVNDAMLDVSSHMEDDLAVVEKQTLLGTIISAMSLGLLLAMLIVTFRYILRQIGGEPERIKSIARRIAEGDLSEELEQQSDATGIYAAIVSMQNNLRDRTEREKASSAYGEQLRQALDNSSSNVMVADTNNDIIFINRASRQLFQGREKEITSTMPHFNASEIVGSNIDIFHKKPEMQKSIVKNLSSTHKTAIEFGGCTFSFVINPVVTDDGTRLGTIVEWFDRTDELENEAEMQALVKAAASGDLSKRIDTQTSSGFYLSLGKVMNELMDVNDRAVGEIQRVFEAIARGDLTAKVEGAYSGVYEQLKNDANATVNQLTEIISKVKNSALIISAASSELISTNKSLNATAEEGAKQAAIATSAASNMTQNMEAVDMAASEMEDSGKEITRNVNEAVEVASRAVTLAQSTNTQVRKLTTSSSDIGNVIKVINSIAEQTNLLALNATIEAARAGDAGKGFAVVANEVKELAKGTASATDEIAQKVKAIQGDSDTAVQAIGDIGEIIETISNYQNTISEAVQNQNMATQRISDNASEAVRGNVEISHTSQRVREGTESTVNGVNEVQTSAEELSRMAVGLSNLVESFKIDDGNTSATLRRAA